jgi:hypothetical protein
LDLVWDSLSLPLYNQQLNCVAECSRVTRELSPSGDAVATPLCHPPRG